MYFDVKNVTESSKNGNILFKYLFIKSDANSV